MAQDEVRPAPPSVTVNPQVLTLLFVQEIARFMQKQEVKSQRRSEREGSAPRREHRVSALR